MSEAPVILLRCVAFAYNGASVLEGVDLGIQAGDFACLIGPNGSGKTTLLKLLLGLLKPDSGEVLVFGTSPQRSLRRLGYVPQNTNLDRQFPVTVREVVRMGRLGMRAGSSYSRSDRQAADAAMAEMELLDLATHPFAGLSGGQRQRALIARALCGEPELLLLDEPTANVDAAAGARFLETLKHLNQRMTILLVSHDLGFVSPLVKTVVCVNRRVAVHPMSDLTGAHIREIYGSEMCMVRHDRDCQRERDGSD